MSQFNVLLKIYQLCSVTHQRTRQCQDLGKMAACSKAGLHYPWWGGQIASNRDVWWPHSYPPQSALPVQRPASSPVQQSPRASPPGSPMASGQRPSPSSASLTSLNHLPVVGSFQGSVSLGGCLSDQLGLEGVDLRTEIMCTQQLQLCQPASASQIAATELINNSFLYK